MTRATKLGGGALALVVLCLAGAYLLAGGSFLVRVGPRLPRSIRRYLIPRPAPSPRMANLPNLYLWAWERPEDLQFLPNKKVGVAFLAKTIYLSSAAPVPAQTELAAVNVRPRMQPLRINPGTPLMAVVRIESVRGASISAYTSATVPPPAFSLDQISRIASEISSTAQITGVSAVQIDFDATLSEHTFYRDLLLEVRKQLPPNFPLTITALASWCIGDRWLTGLPPGTIDEAVPMLFRMGTGTREVTTYLVGGRDFTVPVCSTSLGLSTDEPFSRDILSGKLSVSDQPLSSLRVYVFSPHAWTSQEADPVLKESSQ